MDILKQLNDAVQYIELNLCDEIEMDKLAQIACVTKDSLLRFFSYMTGMTLYAYIRRRRLTQAAEELRGSDIKVIDVAVKYGYDSADAFTKAFVRQHKLTPTQVRSMHQPLRIYPPVSFHIKIKGAEEMDFRLITLEETAVYGVSEQFDGQGYKTREDLRHKMWAEDCDDVPGKICAGKWDQPESRAYDGIWYGLWENGRYMIARQREYTKSHGIEKKSIPGGTYAAFRTGPGGRAWVEFPKLRELIFESWLPSSGYRQKGGLVIEVLHLWTDHDLRNKNRYYEVWLPVEEK